MLFTVSEHIKWVLKLPPSNSLCYICELHFSPDDIREHGPSKRLREDAVPVHFPRNESLSMDHNYVLTSPLELVSMINHSAYCLNMLQKV